MRRVPSRAPTATATGNPWTRPRGFSVWLTALLPGVLWCWAANATPVLQTPEGGRVVLQGAVFCGAAPEGWTFEADRRAAKAGSSAKPGVLVDIPAASDPDHCADIYGMHVLYHYGLERSGLPVHAPAGADVRLGALVRDWGGAFDWHAINPERPVEVKDARLAFSRTDHPLPTYAVEISADGRRLVYTADTGPAWNVGAFALPTAL